MKKEYKNEGVQVDLPTFPSCSWADFIISEQTFILVYKNCGKQ